MLTTSKLYTILKDIENNPFFDKDDISIFKPFLSMDRIVEDNTITFYNDSLRIDFEIVQIDNLLAVLNYELIISDV